VVQVSSSFKNKIYATERKTKAKVSFEILDIEAYQDASVSVSSSAPISKENQTINKIREMPFKYATFERDYFGLDGSFYLPPKLGESESEMGWWSENLSEADGSFLSPPIIEFTFTNPHQSIGLTVTFDTQTNEYATDFLIEVYDPTEALLTSESVVGNTSPIYYFETPIENYSRITITILKWAKASRRARIVEVDFGIVQEYLGDKLISLKVIEEMDLLASTVPSNEMQFILDNSDNAFNILNPNGIYRFLKMNQEMSASIGLLINEKDYEYIPMGKYYLTEWTVEEGAMTSTFVGRDIFTRLELVEYTRLLQNTNLYDLAVDILAEANIENYSIDEGLKDITTVGFTEKIKVREALQMVAIAGKSVIRQSRNGAILLEQYEELSYETGYVTFASTDIFSGMTTPQVYIDYSFQAIDFDNTFEAPKVSLAPAISHLVFKITDAEGLEFDIRFLNSKVKEGQGFEINNPLINSETHASEVATWMFREYNFIAEYNARWRQNPALECGNVVLIEDSFGGKKKSRITKQEFNFQGYMDGITEAKGGI
jgi:hypothetical protein